MVHGYIYNKDGSINWIINVLSENFKRRDNKSLAQNHLIQYFNILPNNFLNDISLKIHNNNWLFIYFCVGVLK